jgi:hypothetical protein
MVAVIAVDASVVILTYAVNIALPEAFIIVTKTDEFPFPTDVGI